MESHLITFFNYDRDPLKGKCFSGVTRDKAKRCPRSVRNFKPAEQIGSKVSISNVYLLIYIYIYIYANIWILIYHVDNKNNIAWTINYPVYVVLVIGYTSTLPSQY